MATGGRTATRDAPGLPLQVVDVPVERIRPEDGLDRKRDREGHKELRDSIQQFGVLTPVTVRLAPDGSGDYLLIKGQGRTLACRMLGLTAIPAVVVDDTFADNEKVQQFLVENVARLRMRPIDRAMLIARARENGEETANVARRFGVSPATVRRLEAQLEDAGPREVAVLREGRVNLTLHAVIARYTQPSDRGDVVAAVAPFALRAKEMQALFVALGWPKLVALGSDYALQRITLLQWACGVFVRLSDSPMSEKVRRLADELPVQFPESSRTRVVL